MTSFLRNKFGRTMQIGKEVACAVGHIWNACLDQVWIGSQYWEGMKPATFQAVAQESLEKPVDLTG